MKISIYLLLFMTSAAGLTWADTLETRDGATLEGTILDEDSSYVYLDTKSGVINIAKIDVSTVNGEPYHYSGQGTVPVQPEKAAQKPPTYLGPSSHTRDQAGKPLPNVGIQFGSSAHLDSSEAAAPAKASTSEEDPVIHPEGIRESQLRQYYNSHPEEFQNPVQLRLKFINAQNLPGDPDSVVKNPSSSKAWKDAGWVKKGDTFNAAFSPADYDRIFNLREGQTLLIQDTFRVPTIFWAVQRKEAERMPYQEARPKVLNKILKNNLRKN